MFKQICILSFVMFATLAANDNPNEQKCKINFTFNLNDHTKKTIPALFKFTRNSNVPSLKALCASVINKEEISIQEPLPELFALQISQQKEDIMNCFRQLIQFIVAQNTQPEKLKESLYNQPLFHHINLKNIEMLQTEVYIKQKKTYALLHLNLKRDPSHNFIVQVFSTTPILPDSSSKKELTHIWHISSQGGAIFTHDRTSQNKALDLEPHEGSDDEFGIEGECVIL